MGLGLLKPEAHHIAARIVAGASERNIVVHIVEAAARRGARAARTATRSATARPPARRRTSAATATARTLNRRTAAEACVIAAGARAATAAEHLHLVGNDFRRIAFLAPLVGPF